MNILRVAKENPKTSVLAIIAVVSNVWNLLSENAELFGVSSKAIAIGSVVLAAAVMIYNSFKE